MSELPLDPGRRGPTRAERRRAGRRRVPEWAWWVITLMIATVVALGLRTYVVQSFWIPSASMEPTLHGCPGCKDDRILVNKLSYSIGQPHRGDVVVFARPAGVPDSDRYLVKRVIGLPGETVSGHDDRVWIGNQPLTESYVNRSCGGTTDFTALVVPAHQLFVMGDNRCDSFDSRRFGTISEKTVVGRAFVIIWPVGRVHWL